MLRGFACRVTSFKAEYPLRKKLVKPAARITLDVVPIPPENGASYTSWTR